MKRLALGLALLLALSGHARADIITLDDGRTIEGEILHESEDEVEIKIPYGSTKLPRSRIVKIVKKSTPEQELKERRAKLDPKDAAGRIELARFVLEKHFPRDKAAELAIEAWRITPGDEGAIEILVTKLDYHFEKDAWLDPEHWYPSHGYVRKNGNFITTEEQTYQDALALVTKLKASLATAENDVKRAQDVITQAPDKAAKLKKQVDDLDATAAALSLKKGTAKTTLDARETDLKIAAEKTIAARRDLLAVQQQGCPTDAAGKQAWNDQVVLASKLVTAAAFQEDKAKRARDAALADFQSITNDEETVLGKLKAAHASFDAIADEVKAMEAALPDRKKERDAAADRLKQGEAAELAARKAADERKARDVKDAAAALAALKAMKAK